MPCTHEKNKDKGKASLIPKEKEGVNEGDEGPSVEVKENESKEGAEVGSSKETTSSLETVDNKPPGDKYSPKVRLRAFIGLLWGTLQCLLLQVISLSLF